MSGDCVCPNAGRWSIQKAHLEQGEKASQGYRKAITVPGMFWDLWRFG